MSKIQLITPLEGQKNWGPAINSNFRLLSEQCKTAVSGYQEMRRILEQSESFSFNSDKFIYIEDGNLYLVPYTTVEGGTVIDWWVNIDNAPKELIEINNLIIVGYQGWFVLTKNNEPEEVNNTMWKTGDLFLIKKMLNSTESIVTQLPNVMGGYFQPVELSVDHSGVVTATFTKTASLATTIETELFYPLVCWKPVTYDAATGQLIYQAYYIDPDGAHIPLNNVTSQMVDIAYTTKGHGNEYILENPKNQVIIYNLFSGTSDGLDGVGFDIHFYDEDGNILYFPYSYERPTWTNNLVIQIARGSCNSTIKVRVNIFNTKGEV